MGFRPDGGRDFRQHLQRHRGPVQLSSSWMGTAREYFLHK
jgi:hypothetical protein